MQDRPALNPIALRMAKIVYNFGPSEYSRVRTGLIHIKVQEIHKFDL